MTAKEYLEQIKKLDKLIENKMYEKIQWKSIATGTSASTGGERVQSSGNPQKMECAVTRYIEIESEIDALIDEYVDKKKGIIANIEKLPAQEYDLLHKVYVQDVNFSDVADMCDKTYSWVTTVHGRALQHLQVIIDNEYSTI